MKNLIILVGLFSNICLGETFVSNGTGDIPKMTIRLVDGYVYIQGALGMEYKTKAIQQHAEIYFSIPSDCKCGVMSGEYSGVPTTEFLELFTPYFGVLPIVKEKP